MNRWKRVQTILLRSLGLLSSIFCLSLSLFALKDSNPKTNECYFTLHHILSLHIQIYPNACSYKRSHMKGSSNMKKFGVWELSLGRFLYYFSGKNLVSELLTYCCLEMKSLALFTFLIKND